MKKDRRNLVVSGGILAAVLILLMLVPGEEPYSEQEIDLTSVPENSTVEAVFLENGTEIASLELEVSDSDEEREKGLMNRSSLEPGTGMLFVWNSSEKRSFWMKNTYIPLDMIFLEDDRTVLNIKEADPEPDTEVEELEVYQSDGPAQYVIETHQGFSENRSIEEGTKISFSISR
jgi:uncharacterized membrane protein (UPF0127 family)